MSTTGKEGYTGDFGANFAAGEYNDPSPELAFGMTGALIGGVIGVEAYRVEDQRAQSAAIAAHPSKKSAIESGSYPYGNHYAEAGIFLAPTLALAALGLALGKKFVLD